MKTIFTSVTIILFFSFLSAQAQHNPFQLAISVQQADSAIKAHINSDHPFNIIDLRTDGEFAAGYIEGAVNLNFYSPGIDDSLAKLDRDQEYLIYCGSGGRSGQAFNKMKALQFKMVYNMLGGTSAWKNGGYPLVTKGSGIDFFKNSPVVVQVYPNPITTSSKFVLLDASGQSVEVKLMNMSGQIIDQFELIPGGQKLIDTNELVLGVYFFQVYLNGEITQTGKLIKTQ